MRKNVKKKEKKITVANVNQEETFHDKQKIKFN